MDTNEARQIFLPFRLCLTTGTLLLSRGGIGPARHGGMSGMTSRGSGMSGGVRRTQMTSSGLGLRRLGRLSFTLWAVRMLRFEPKDSWWAWEGAFALLIRRTSYGASFALGPFQTADPHPGDKPGTSRAGSQNRPGIGMRRTIQRLKLSCRLPCLRTTRAGENGEIPSMEVENVEAQESGYPSAAHGCCRST